MMESVSKAGSAIAPQIVDLGGQVDNVHIEHMMRFTDSLPPDEEAFASKACGNKLFKFQMYFEDKKTLYF